MSVWKSDEKLLFLHVVKGDIKLCCITFIVNESTTYFISVDIFEL